MERKSLPPGFRFHPTDVELVMYYLKRKVMGKKLHSEAIADVDIYRFSPWDLPDMSCLKSKDLEWFFFCPKEKKYARGVRVKRATEKGYWKTTGKDRNVLYGEKIVGTIKTLVFHFGHAPKGERTDWVIHEYKIIDAQLAATGLQDTYVLCKVFKKNGPGPKVGAQYGAPFTEEDWSDDDVNDSEIRAASSIPDVLPSTALTPEKQSCISTGSLLPEITSGASGTKKCSNVDQTYTISAQFLPGRASGPSTALTPEKQSCISTGSLIPEIKSCSLATKECSNVFQQYAITGHFHPGSASGSVHPGSACGLSLGEGLQLPAGPTSSQLLDQEFGDDIDRFLASFTDDPLLLENGQHEDDLNGMGMPCLDGYGIYSGLQSLNNISIPVDEPRFGSSGMPQDDHNSSLNMLMQDSSGYIELDDLAVPLDFSTEAFGNGQLYDAAAVGSYSDGNMPQLCVSGIDHPPPCIDQLPMLSNQSHQDNQFCLGSDAEYDPYTYGQSGNGQNAGCLDNENTFHGGR